jgi:ribosomal protein S18 acetylase RimI-like enzyme
LAEGKKQVLINFRVLKSFDANLISKLTKLEVNNLGREAAVNQWQLPVIIRYGKFVVAENEQGDIIGVCEMFRQWEQPLAAFIHSFYIEESYRYRGIGKNLLENVIDILKEDGFKSVQLTVGPDNKTALSLYGRFGFEKKLLEIGEYGEGYDRFLMELVFDGK